MTSTKAIDLRPEPNAWPECPTCNASYAMKRGLSITTGEMMWAWYPECKHKSEPRLVGPMAGVQYPSVEEEEEE